MTIQELGQQLRSGRTSSVAVTEACLHAIEARDPRAERVHPRAARASARTGARGRRGAGRRTRPRPAARRARCRSRICSTSAASPTTAASQRAATDVAAHDSAAVVHLRQAGAVDHRQDEPARVRVRHDQRGLGIRPGATSARSARARRRVERRIGGQRRDGHGARHGRHRYRRVHPHSAAACGLVGLKPTVGEMSTDGVVPLSHTLDHVGPLARTVTDAWHLLQALIGHAGPKPLTASPSRRPALRRFRGATSATCSKPTCAHAFEATVAALERAGAHIAPSRHRTRRLHRDRLPADRVREAAAYHAATLEAMPESYTRAGPAASGDGALRPRRGLRARDGRPRRAAARSGRRAVVARRADAADAADCRAAARRHDRAPSTARRIRCGISCCG